MGKAAKKSTSYHGYFAHSQKKGGQLRKVVEGIGEERKLDGRDFNTKKQVGGESGPFVFHA